MVEMKLWRASESQVRRALDRDIEKFGESSPFVKVVENLYALRSWEGRSTGERTTNARHLCPVAR